MVPQNDPQKKKKPKNCQFLLYLSKKYRSQSFSLLKALVASYLVLGDLSMAALKATTTFKQRKDILLHENRKSGQSLYLPPSVKICKFNELQQLASIYQEYFFRQGSLLLLFFFFFFLLFFFLIVLLQFCLLSQIGRAHV